MDERSSFFPNNLVKLVHDSAHAELANIEIRKIHDAESYGIMVYGEGIFWVFLSSSIL
jgi:hypothetical protein